jgi:hypothetical protein
MKDLFYRREIPVVVWIGILYANRAEFVVYACALDPLVRVCVSSLAGVGVALLTRPDLQ